MAYLKGDRSTLYAKRDVEALENTSHIIPDVLYPAWSGLLDNHTGYTFTDSSASAHAVVESVGDIHQSGSTKKIGNTSLSFPGTAQNSIRYADSTDWDFGTGVFTIECWINPSKVTSSASTICCRAASDSAVVWMLRITSSSKLEFTLNNASGSDHETPSYTVPVNTWTHIAIVRGGDDNRVRIYANGTEVYEAGAVDSGSYDGSYEWWFGANPTGSQNYLGYIDDFRYVKGLAVYTGNFTAPTSALSTTWSANPFGGSNTVANSTASDVKLLLHSEGGGHVGAYGTEQADGRKYYYTDINGSKPIKDPRIGAHYGSHRHRASSLQLLEQETGTHNRDVYSIDGRDWFRAVNGSDTTGSGGSVVPVKWEARYDNGGHYLMVGDSPTNAFIEIVGYFNDFNTLVNTGTDSIDDIDVKVNGAFAQQGNTLIGGRATQYTPLRNRFVNKFSPINVGSTIQTALGTTPAINTLKIEATNGSGEYFVLSGIELIAQDTTSTANKSKIQIPAQNVISYGKKFSLSAAAHHYNPFGTKGDDSASTIPNNTTGDSVATGWAGATSAYWDSSLDTATSLGLSAWESGGNYYRPVNGGRVVKWVDSSGNIKTSVNMMPPEADVITGLLSSFATGGGTGSNAATGTHNWSTQYQPQFGSTTIGSNLYTAMTDNGSYPFETRPGGGLNGAWNNTSGYGLAYVSVSLTLGKLYRIRFDASSVSGIASYIGPATNSSATNWRGKALITAGTNITSSFRATANDVMIVMHTGNGAAAFTLANLSLYEIEEPSSQAEVAKTFHWREFGNGSVNGNASYADASMLVVNTLDSIGYVMDDGLTALNGHDVRAEASVQSLGPNTSKSWYMTFIGTGISIKNKMNSASVISHVQVAQNLPFGTHTMSVARGGSGTEITVIIDGVTVVNNFDLGSWDYAHFQEVTYHQPKMPPIPDDAVVIADYMLMADFVNNTGTTNHLFSKGTRKLSSSREIFYDGPQTFPSTVLTVGTDSGYYPDNMQGIWASSSGVTTAKLPFFGTNLIAGTYQVGGAWTMNMDGSSATITKYDNASHYGDKMKYSGTALVPGLHNVDSISPTGGIHLGMEIGSPVHTSSHYQPFETLYAYELVGGDRNMEQTNLVVAPDGKTWDQVTRDTSYMSGASFSGNSDGYTQTDQAVLVKLDEWRGLFASAGTMFNKHFAIAYDRIICLYDGQYHITCHQETYGSGVRGNILWIKGKAHTRFYEDGATPTATGWTATVDLSRGDDVYMTGVWGTNRQYTQFIIHKI